MQDAKSSSTGAQSYLFVTCFISLVATSFGFISRAFMLTDWGRAFDLSNTQQGEIFGAGLYPFAISIVLFSLVIDRIGYKTAMWFAFAAHMISAAMTILAVDYWSLYAAAFVGGLANGTIEAVINPVIATAYSKQKTKWLNILHAGWPCGLMLAGMMTIALAGMGVGDWRVKVAIVFIPVILYGILLIRCTFPVNERVAAGVPYMDMLKEPGGLGIFIIVTLILTELGRVICGQIEGVETPYIALLAVSALIALAYGAYVRALGRPMYVLMLLVMVLLATTELGTDGWIKDLLTPVMKMFQLDGGWVLVYTSMIMMLLRFATGPILKITRLSPLGLLSVSCVLVIAGLAMLSKLGNSTQVPVVALLLGATIYGAGQCFFWPTTLGFISERFPRGGALSLNAIAGVGMLGVGILGGPWLGYIQDTSIAANLKAQDASVYRAVVESEPSYLYGLNVLPYHRLDSKQSEIVSKRYVHLAMLIEKAQNAGKSDALLKVTILPAAMLAVYLGLIAYFRFGGGYEPIELDTAQVPIE